MPFAPSERDILIALLDSVLALSDRLFPEERMVVRIVDTETDGGSFAYASGATLTRWEPR